MGLQGQRFQGLGPSSLLNYFIREKTSAMLPLRPLLIADPEMNLLPTSAPTPRSDGAALPDSAIRSTCGTGQAYLPELARHSPLL